jgi:hypothetical protein
MPTAFIIPYRDRAQHLAQFIPAITPYLKDGDSVIVVEQEKGKPFNRAKLLNIGAVEAFRSGATHVVTHDVDMIPIEADYTPADCIHLAGRAEQFGYKMPFNRYFGGVNMFSKWVFEKVNGYSNEYWGWGAEDCDMLIRCERTRIRIQRRKCMYNSLSHVHGLELADSGDMYAANMARLKKRVPPSLDGLTTLSHTVVSDEQMSGYRLITVSI